MLQCSLAKMLQVGLSAWECTWYMYHDTPEVFSVQSQCSCYTQIFESSLCLHIKLWKTALCLPETPPSIMMFVMCHKTQSLESVFGSKSNRNHQTSKTLFFSFKHQNFHQSQDYSRKQFSSQNHCFYLPSPPLKLIKNPSISWFREGECYCQEDRFPWAWKQLWLPPAPDPIEHFQTQRFQSITTPHSRTVMKWSGNF